MIPGEIHIHIERIVIDGMDASNIQGIDRAIRVELERLVAQQSTANYGMNDSHIETLKAGSVQCAEEKSGATIGKRIAGSVFGHIGA